MAECSSPAFFCSSADWNSGSFELASCSSVLGSGAVSTDYHYQKGDANLFVIGHHGHILLKVIGAIDDAKMQRVQEAIDRQLKGANP